jgi:secondary thiamine-phosphate synthase enzyme
MPKERKDDEGRTSQAHRPTMARFEARWSPSPIHGKTAPMSSVHQRTLEIATPGRGLTDVTRAIAEIVEASGVETGLCSIFLQHTSASLLVQENADPSVLRDLERWMEKLAPEDSRAYEHDDEGPDDMPGHLRSAVTRTGETLPVSGGRLALGTWQAIYLWEHRRLPHRRRIVVTLLGERADR